MIKWNHNFGFEIQFCICFSSRDFSDVPSSKRSSIVLARRTSSVPSWGSTEIVVNIVDSRNALQPEWVGMVSGIFFSLLLVSDQNCDSYYSVYHWFGQGKLVNIVSILNPSQISLLHQLRQKTKLMSKVVKTDTKIIISLPKI